MKQIKSRYFFTWSRAKRDAKRNCEHTAQEKKIEAVAKEIIDRYETELEKVSVHRHS